MTFKIIAKSSAGNIVQVMESFDWFFEDPVLVVLTTNVLFIVSPMFYFPNIVLKEISLYSS